MLRAVRLMPLAFCLLALPVQATVFTVTKTADTLDGACDHDCSLREAVSAANVQESEGPSDVVVVPAGIYRLERLGAGEDANATGDLDVHDRMILVGAGAGSTVLDGVGLDRVLDVRARTEIFGVTIRNGRVDGDGGGLLVRPVSPDDGVFLRRSVVSGNLAQNGGIGGGTGGGIAVHGILEVSESAILENQAEGEGGGIAAPVRTGGTYLSVTNSTVSGNLAHGSGGGLFYVTGAAHISASTIVENEALVYGGGIAARTPLFPGEYPPDFSGSILAYNVAPVNADCAAPANSDGYNVIWTQGDCDVEPTDKVHFLDFPIPPPLITHLLDFGRGPTPVYTLPEHSVALDMVPASHCQPADQVGQARTAPCDAGAWERVDRPVCVPGGSVLCLQNGRFRVSAVWSLDDRFPGAAAQAVPLTDDTGNYWFFDPENLEVMVKVLNGCGLNQHWWVFSSGLTDVGVTLRVEDLETGRTWENVHPKGSTYPPRLDTGAFPCTLTARSAADGPPVPGGAAPPSAVHLVTKTADTDDGSCDHDCSLREAVLRANLWGEGVIVLGPGVYTLGIPGADEDHGHTGDLDQTGQTGSLLILGAGAKRTVIDGGGLDRVIDARGFLELHGVEVRGGRTAGSGGGIQSQETLALVRSTVRSNRADIAGGGIAAFGILTARESTISGNVAGSSGGGIMADLATLQNVTLSGNQAGLDGGGAAISYIQVILENVTITDNTAQRWGGGLSVSSNCTTLCPPGELEMWRTVIADNIAGNAFHTDCDAPAHAGTHNLFGMGVGCSPSLGDLSGAPGQWIDLGLTPLGDHGGPTPTHALLPHSDAIDLAPAASCPQADQRGRPRPADGDEDGSALCDAGAVERLPGCQPDEETLCLGENDRFRVTARWTAQGATGSGKAVPLAAVAGSFWFFDAANLEITVKVLNGCGLNDRFWVFLSGLTDVGVEVTVEDTATGNTWTHEHAAGTPLQPRLDTNALSCANL